MKINKFGAILLTSEELFKKIYSTDVVSLDNVYLIDKIEMNRFNYSIDLNKDDIDKISQWEDPNQTLEEFDKTNQSTWFMPEEYANMDIENLLKQLCPKENYNRLYDELILFQKHNMTDLLRYLKYLVDTMKSNNITWGIGRGSSVASYALYLLGIHKIDSIKYGLSIDEFLKGD